MSKKIRVKSLIVLAALCYVCYIFVNQQIIMHNIKLETNNAEQEVNKLQEKNQKLQDEVKMSKTDMYIEKLAREKLNLIKEGETPVINSK